MKIVILTLGSVGDLMPFLAVAERLRGRGHHCVIASNAGYAQLVRMAGFEFAAIWERTQQSLDDVLARDPVRAWEKVRDEMFVPATRPAFDLIAQTARRGPCMVLASWAVLGARLAHIQLGTPLATAYLSPHALALPDAADDPGQKMGFFPDWFAPEAQVPRLGFPMHDDALIPPLPPQLEDFVRNDAPPIVVTPGSFMRNAASLLRASLEACEQLGRRAVLLTPYAGQVPALPTWARHFPYIALQRLLPRAAAIIHHGGIGTAAQAMRAGIPQLIAPVFFDQFDNAARLEALGAGRRLHRHDATEIAAALGALLPASAACASLATRFAGADAAASVCDRLESL